MVGWLLDVCRLRFLTGLLLSGRKEEEVWMFLKRESRNKRIKSSNRFDKIKED